MADNPYRQAADVMRERGWRKGPMVEAEPSVCLMDALFVVNYNISGVALLYDVIVEIYPMTRVTPYSFIHLPRSDPRYLERQKLQHVITWNDRVCNGGAEAIAILEKTAARFEELVTP